MHNINNVSGDLVLLEYRNGKQYWESKPRKTTAYGEPATMTVAMRFDDSCRNGHLSFGITSTVLDTKVGRCIAGGCNHEEIAKTFPELAPFIKWHGCSTDGPMHYIANTTYHAGDLDYNGLRKGEKRQIKNGKTGALCWELVQVVDGKEVPMPTRNYGMECLTPPPPIITKYVPWCTIGEGKERELSAARRVAVWDDATDEQLCAEGLEETLKARLPALLDEFKQAMLGCGFIYQT
jgi:hypothetical protein